MKSETWNDFLIVLRKEIVDALRDRRTLLRLLIPAVLMGPLLLMALSGLIASLEERAEKREVMVAGIEHAPSLRNYLERQTFTTVKVDGDYEAALRASKLLNPVLVILLAPLSARLLARLGWPEFRVQGIGMLVLGASFVLLQLLQDHAAQGAVIPAWMMVGVIGVQTLAELLVVPIGLAVVSRYGPAGWGSTLMGAWMLAKATAGLLAGQLYGWLQPTGLSLYLVVTAISFAGGLLLISVSGALRRYADMGGKAP